MSKKTADTAITITTGSGTTTGYHSIKGQFSTSTNCGAFFTLKPKSKEEAIKQILHSIETGDITREDLVRTIEFERLHNSKNKLNNIINNTYFTDIIDVLECTERALLQYDLENILDK